MHSKIIFVFLFLGAILLTAADTKEISADMFLRNVRALSGSGTWGILSGTASHRRRGSRRVEAPVRFSVLFSKESKLARIVFRKNEVYNLYQQCHAPYRSSVEKPEKSTLSDFGLRPDDITLNFIYLPLKKEFPQQRVRSVSCRVFAFEPEDRKEHIRVYISKEYCFPLRVEWYGLNQKDGKPFRTLEIDSFEKISDLWVIKSLSLFGPGWTTTIEFKDIHAGLSKNGIPQDLF